MPRRCERLAFHALAVFPRLDRDAGLDASIVRGDGDDVRAGEADAEDANARRIEPGSP